MNKRNSFLAMICALALTAGVFYGSAVNAEETVTVIAEEVRTDAARESAEELAEEGAAAEEAGAPESVKPAEEEASEPESVKPAKEEAGAPESVKPAEEEAGAPESVKPAEEEAQAAQTEEKGKNETETNPAPDADEAVAKEGSTPAEKEEPAQIQEALPIHLEINGEKMTILVGPEGVAVLLKAAHEGDAVLKITKIPGLQLTRGGQEEKPAEADEETLTFVIPVRTGENEIVLQAARESGITLAAEWQTEEKSERDDAPAEGEPEVPFEEDEPLAEDESDVESSDETAAKDPALSDDTDGMKGNDPEKDRSPLAEVLEGIPYGDGDEPEVPEIDIVIEEKTEDPAADATEQQEKDSPEDPAADAMEQQEEDFREDSEKDTAELQEEPMEELMEGEKTEENEPLRRVELISSLDGRNSVPAGTEITLTVELTGLMEDEIAEVVWMYRQEDDPPETYHVVEEADGLTYTYSISEENARHQWRVMLKLDS